MGYPVSIAITASSTVTVVMPSVGTIVGFSQLVVQTAVEEAFLGLSTGVPVMAAVGGLRVFVGPEIMRTGPTALRVFLYRESPTGAWVDRTLSLLSRTIPTAAPPSVLTQAPAGEQIRQKASRLRSRFSASTVSAASSAAVMPSSSMARPFGSGRKGPSQNSCPSVLAWYSLVCYESSPFMAIRLRAGGASAHRRRTPGKCDDLRESSSVRRAK